MHLLDRAEDHDDHPNLRKPILQRYCKDRESCILAKGCREFRRNYGGRRRRTVGRGEERELLRLPLLLQEVVDLFCRRCALKLLPVHFALSDLLEADVAFRYQLGAAEVAPAHARRDEVRHAAALPSECLRVDGDREKILSKAKHLEQAQTDYCGHSIIAPAASCDETDAKSYDVLECASQRHTRHVRYDLDVEVRSLEEKREHDPTIEKELVSYLKKNRPEVENVIPELRNPTSTATPSQMTSLTFLIDPQSHILLSTYTR